MGFYLYFFIFFIKVQLIYSVSLNGPSHTQFPVLRSRAPLPHISNIRVCIQKPRTACPSHSLPLPPGNHKSALLGHDLFLLCKQDHLCHILDSTNQGHHVVFVLFFLAFFTQYEYLQFHPFCCKWHQFIFLWLSSIPLCICTTTS